jgi:hypothetical protein
MLVAVAVVVMVVVGLVGGTGEGCAVAGSESLPGEVWSAKVSLVVSGFPRQGMPLTLFVAAIENRAGSGRARASVYFWNRDDHESPILNRTVSEREIIHHF